MTLRLHIVNGGIFLTFLKFGRSLAIGFDARPTTSKNNLVRWIAEPSEPVQRVLTELHSSDDWHPDQAFIIGVEDAWLSMRFWVVTIGMKSIRLKP